MSQTQTNTEVRTDLTQDQQSRNLVDDDLFKDNSEVKEIEEQLKRTNDTLNQLENPSEPKMELSKADMEKFNKLMEDMKKLTTQEEKLKYISNLRNQYQMGDVDYTNVNKPETLKDRLKQRQMMLRGSRTSKVAQLYQKQKLEEAAKQKKDLEHSSASSNMSKSKLKRMKQKAKRNLKKQENVQEKEHVHDQNCDHDQESESSSSTEESDKKDN
jgi:hypothetical protein